MYIAEIEKSADGIKAMPAAFERELHLVQKDIDELIEKLTAVRKRIAVESGKIANDSDKKYIDYISSEAISDSFKLKEYIES